METKELAPKKSAKSAVSSLTLGNADDALTLAKELQRFVKQNNLTSTIQGREFPQVEAWQFAGSLLGLTSMLESIEDKSTADEIKWHATITVHNAHTGAVVGRGFASCSNKEKTKRYFEDYAICSMAQTRAVGKAYRLFAGWLMKAAGYEATPLEEMPEPAAEAKTSAAVVVERSASNKLKTELRQTIEMVLGWGEDPGARKTLALLDTLSESKAAEGLGFFRHRLHELSATGNDQQAA